MERNGLIPVDKPCGWTSHDVVLKVRSCLGVSRVGHFGTLDPHATGLLLVALGHATRFFPFYSKSDKSYRGRIKLGLATDTYDAQGRPAAPECFDLPDVEKLRAAMSALTGPGRQTPPPFSAKKIKGQPSYKLARRQKAVPLKDEDVTIHSFVLEVYDPPWIDFSVSCSSGTYIRALAHDLGKRLECGAHLHSLCRTASGEYRLEQAFSLEEVERMASRGEWDRFLIPIASLLPFFPALQLSESGIKLARNGNFLSPGEFEDSAPHAQGIFRLFDPEGNLVALARREGGSPLLRPFLVLR